MSDDTENTDGQNTKSRQPQSQERLEALTARRAAQSGVTPAAPTAAPPAPAQQRGGRRRGQQQEASVADGLFPGPRQGGGMPARALLRIFQVLSKTPEDDRGMVDGTRFTVAGVERLMSVLKERAGDAQHPAHRASAALLAHLEAGPDVTDPDDVVAGASADRLEEMSRRFAALRRRVRRARNN